MTYVDVSYVKLR